VPIWSIGRRAASEAGFAPKTSTKLLLETSEALAYLNDESRAQDVGRLLDLAEQGRITIAMAEAGWDEIHHREEAAFRRSIALLAGVLHRQMNGARWDNFGSAWGGVVWGSDNSADIDKNLPKRMSQADRDQFIAFEAGGYDYVITSDGAFTQHQTQEKVIKPLKLEGRVGNATEALTYLATTWSLTPSSDSD